MLRHVRRRKQGFTLIELVMVIAIIGVLAAIIMPKFSSQRVKADEAATRANLESLRTALQTYISQTGTVPPDGAAVIAALVPTYLRTMPNAVTVSAGVTTTSALIPSGPGTPVGTAGGWWYRYNSPTNYEIYVNSTAASSDGSLYSSW